jgi:uncharacterized BrkB/YihY/UPF0761 family membrane protein
MARGFFGLPFGVGSSRSLSARGQCLNTFAGIGFSLVFSLLALGGYLIEQEFANPMEAQSVGLLLAALLIATSVTLLYCLLHPSTKSRDGIAAWPAAVAWEQKNVVVARSASRTPQAADIPLPGRYVDRARIRIQR